MSIEFKPGRYFIALWFVHCEEAAMNWMAAVYKDTDEVWHLVYRFRYFKDNKAIDSDDEKSWYSASLRSGEKTEQEIEKNLDTMACVLSTRANGELSKLDFHSSDSDAMMMKLAEQKWANIMSTSPGGSA